MRYSDHAEKVHEYFKSRGGRQISSQQVQKDLGITSANVSNAYAYITERLQDRRLVKVRTGWYEYRASIARDVREPGAGLQNGALTEVIGHVGDGGQYIARDETGKLYTLSPL